MRTFLEFNRERRFVEVLGARTRRGGGGRLEAVAAGAPDARHRCGRDFRAVTTTHSKRTARSAGAPIVPHVNQDA